MSFISLGRINCQKILLDLQVKLRGIALNNYDRNEPIYDTEWPLTFAIAMETAYYKM